MDIPAVSFVDTAYRRVMNIRQMSYAGEGIYKGRTHNPISHVSNIEELEIVS